MKKFVIVLLIILAVAAIIALDQAGILNWQPLSMIAAALAGPFRLFIGMFSNKEEEIRQKHEQIRKAEAEYQTGLETKIQQRQQDIQSLEQELDRLDLKLADLRDKRNQIDAEVDAMTPDELAEAGRELWGTE